MLKRAYIEILNECNLNCAFCKKNHRPPLIMSPEEFHRILKQVRQLTPYIYLHVQGEPMIHPQFEDILSICDEESVHVQLVTNGTMLYQYPNLHRHSCLRKVSFSLQSIEYQKNTDPDHLIDQIIGFAHAASDAGIVTEIRFWRNDQLEMNKTARCLSRLRDQFEFIPAGRNDNYQIMPKVYVDFDNMFQWPDSKDDSTDGPVKGRCHGGIDQIAILSNETVVPCCLDADANIDLGNLHETSLADILSSQRYLNLIHGFQKQQVLESFCQSCTFRHRFD